MADYFLVIDGDTNQRKRGGLAITGSGGFADSDFDVTASGGQTTFALGFAVTSSMKIDVIRNGVLAREGGAYDWTRDTTNNAVVFNASVPKNAWVRVRVYS